MDDISARQDFDLLDPRCEITEWKKKDNFYAITYSWDDVHTMRLHITVAGIGYLDSRLPVIMPHLTSGSDVDHELIRVNLLSCWKTPGLPVDAQPERDGLGLTGHYLYGMDRLRRHASKPDIVEVRIQAYRTLTLDDGTVFAHGRINTVIQRPPSWLEQHFNGAAATFALAEAMGCNPEETAAMLFARHKPTLTTVATSTLPSDYLPE